MLGSLRGIAAAAAAATLVVTTSAAVAAPADRAPTPVSVAPAPASEPWLILSAMTASSTEAVTAAAAQEERGKANGPPLGSLAVILSTIGTAIYILLKNDGSDGDRDGNSGASSGFFVGIGIHAVPVSPP